MAQTLTPTVSRPSDDAEVPPLVNGDNLTADEFMRRYEAMPEDCNAELIGGIVYMASPVSHRPHGRSHLTAAGWLWLYMSRTPGLDGGDNSTTWLDADDVVQPDLFLRLPESAGGTSRLEGDYISGPPELVLEIAASSSAIDLNQKRAGYRRAGVAEYLVWRTRDRVVDWFLRDGDRFVPQPVGEDGLLRSRVLPGLWLAPAALLDRDLPRLSAAVESGCQTDEHAAFVRRLTTAQPSGQ